MQKIHFSILINAPRERVWNAMLGDETYREWTKPFSAGFNAGSYFIGNWEEGSEMRFLGVDESSKEESGMFSKIRENRKYEFISIEHLGFISKGVVDTESDEVKKWIPSFENYTFLDKDGGTELQVDIDVADEHKDMFEGMWPKSLEILKEIAERK